MAKAGSFLQTNLSWSPTMDAVFAAEVNELVNNDPRKSYSDFGNPLPLGVEFQTIRDRIVSHGRANFSQSIRLRDNRTFSPKDRVLLYCYAYLRPHFWSAYANFRLNKSWLDSAKKSRKVVLIDVGCGPGTAGLAWAELFNSQKLDYLGVDSAEAMRIKAKTFLTKVFAKRIKQRQSVVRMYTSWANLPKTFPDDCIVIFNFSFFFASVSLTISAIRELVETIQKARSESLGARFFVSYTNSTIQERNRNYFQFLRELGYDWSDTKIWNNLPECTVRYLNRPYHREPRQAKFVGELFELD